MYFFDRSTLVQINEAGISPIVSERSPLDDKLYSFSFGTLQPVGAGEVHCPTSSKHEDVPRRTDIPWLGSPVDKETGNQSRFLLGETEEELRLSRNKDGVS